MKRYLESLTNEELKTIIAYNNDLRNMLEEKYIEDTMYYVGDILDVIGGGDYSIGFYQYNYWYSTRTRKSMEAIIEATEAYGLCSEKEIEKVGVDQTSDLVRKLSFANYNKRFKSPNQKAEISDFFSKLTLKIC